MKFETKLRRAINKILDLVSAKEQDWNKKSGWRRWGFDTDCGDNEELVNEAIEILVKYGIVQINHERKHIAGWGSLNNGKEKMD